MSTVVLVTGAGSGIGRAAALELARRGCTVHAAGRTEAPLLALQQEAPDGAVVPHVLDVRDDASRRALAHRLAADGVVVDVLVNCAGVAVSGPLLETDPATVEDVLATNAVGLFALTQLLARPMVERRRGRVVNVSSTAGRFVGPMSGAYSASKFALEALSDGLRMELAGLGVQVVLVEPGAVATGFAERSVERLTIDPDGPYARLIPKVPVLVKRSQAGATTPDRVATVIAEAALTPRPRARYVTPGAARVAVAATALLPTRVVDALFRRAAFL